MLQSLTLKSRYLLSGPDLSRLNRFTRTGPRISWGPFTEDTPRSVRFSHQKLPRSVWSASSPVQCPPPLYIISNITLQPHNLTTPRIQALFQCPENGTITQRHQKRKLTVASAIPDMEACDHWGMITP